MRMHNKELPKQAFCTRSLERKVCRGFERKACHFGGKRGVAQLGLERTVRVREVGGSNPLAPTKSHGLSNQQPCDFVSGGLLYHLLQTRTIPQGWSAHSTSRLSMPGRRQARRRCSSEARPGVPGLVPQFARTRAACPESEFHARNHFRRMYPFRQALPRCFPAGASREYNPVIRSVRPAL